MFVSLPQTLRIQSPEGTKRIDVHPTDSILEVFEKVGAQVINMSQNITSVCQSIWSAYIIALCCFQVHDIFGLTGYGFALYRKRGCQDELISSRSKTVRSYGLSHGDMLYMAPLNGAMLWSENSNPRPSTSSGVSKPNNILSGVPVDSTELASVPTQSHVRQLAILQEDEVDLQLWKLDGKVQRKRDEKL